MNTCPVDWFTSDWSEVINLLFYLMVQYFSSFVQSAFIIYLRLFYFNISVPQYVEMGLVVV